MNEQKFRKSVIIGANNLLDMMAFDPNGKFSKTVTVSAPPTRDPSFPLRYSFPVNDFVREGAQLFIRETAFPNVTITRLLMRKGKKLVTVELPSKLKNLFYGVDYRDITFRSDMRFLIERIKDFYDKTSISFTPPAPKQLPPCSLTLAYPLSEAQSRAVESVLSNPVSYVWGAPGTGKTNAVLVTCLLRYLNADKRVALLAPTNNAVEQVLRGILPILKSAGVDLRKLYRVGAASYEFAQEFPEVVGDTALQTTQEELAERRKALLVEEQDVQKTASEILSTERRIGELVSARNKLAALSSDYASFSSQEQEEKQLLDDAEAALHAAEEAASVAGKAFSEQDRLLSYYQTAIEAKEKQHKKLRLLPWKATVRRALKLDILHLNGSKEAALHEYPILRDKNKSAIAEKAVAVREYYSHKQSYDSVLHKIEACREDMRTVLKNVSVTIPGSAFPADYTSAIETRLTKENESLSALRAKPLRSSEQIQQELTEIQQNLDALGESDKLKQMKNARVLCGTFDTMVRYLPKQEDADPYEHVFIDEAGYTSLARGMMAFSCGCPVAFFGDHYQLPPICVMPAATILIHNPNVVHWALPVIAYSDLVKRTKDSLLDLLDEKNGSPVFDCLSYSPLLKTYRFGSQLASLLDFHIYRTGMFRGVENMDFNIIVLHGKKDQNEYKKRKSQNEALAIKRYVQSSSFEEDAFAILTPYNRQVNLLMQYLPEWKENIMTVHKSQGQEWDTVILSVVDTSDKFLVDSQIKQGRSVLNTAISRTKKTLVIACDTGYWRNQPEQIVSDLVSIADNQDLPF